jgi:exodeoxyribonuclease V beta subunit
VLVDAVADVLDTPLTAETPPLTLRQIPTHRRLNELEFVCPVALGDDHTPAGALTAARLGDAFAAHGAPWLAGDYAARVRGLPFGPLSGYLKGYVDLVFEHDARWFLVDYKTNDLGSRPVDYRRSALLTDMQRHHYLLQYHLYAVALHRYLQQRLVGYDYARHFGGVLYLFVRGMAPAHEPGCGVFFDRPAGALIDALSDLFEPRPAEVERRI